MLNDGPQVDLDLAFPAPPSPDLDLHGQSRAITIAMTDSFLIKGRPAASPLFATCEKYSARYGVALGRAKTPTHIWG